MVSKRAVMIIAAKVSSGYPELPQITKVDFSRCCSFPQEYHMGGRCRRRPVPTFLSQVEVRPRARTTIAISIAPHRTLPMITAVFEPLPPGFKDAPAGRAEGQCWDETRKLTVANAMAFEGEGLVELAPLIVSPGPISGLSDKRRCDMAWK